MTESSSLNDGLKAIIQIFRSNYCSNDDFKKLLKKELQRRTGNDNLGKICEVIWKA